MSLKTVLISALVAMGMDSIADKIQNQTQHFNMPDPTLTPRRKKSAGGKGGSSHTWGIRPRPRHHVTLAPYVPAPPPRNTHRKPNKLQLIERVANDSAAMEGMGIGNYACAALAGVLRVPLSHITEARQRVIDIRRRDFETKRLPLQRAKIIELGGDPDMGDTLEFDAGNEFDGVRLVRATRPSQETREIRTLSEPQARYVAR